MQPRITELFSGAGLLGAGFKQAGFKTICAIDLDADAITSYNQNLKTKVGRIADVKDIDSTITCDVIVAGPPCQGFSSLGKRDSNDQRNQLSTLLVHWADSTNAKVVVLENVPQFVESTQLKDLVNKFRSRGFTTTSWILSATKFNVAQTRSRSFTIFSKLGKPCRPSESKTVLTVKDAFSGLSRKSDRKGMHYSAEPIGIALERIQRIPPCGGKSDLVKHAPHLCPESWFKLGSQATDVWGRMDYNKPSNTIRCCFTNPSKGRYLHPSEDRVITPREGARLQGVPDSWDFCGSTTSKARQIGNGVPLPLGYAVATSIRALF